MTAFARHFFALSRTAPDSSLTFREQLDAMAQTSPQADQVLHGPPFPVELADAWSMFSDVQSGRGSSGFGPSPLSHAEILAWSTLTGIEVRPWHLHGLRALDHAFLSAVTTDAKSLDFAKLADPDTES